MACACRSNSLRVFVQSLTDVRVANPAFVISSQLNHLSLLVPSPHSQARHRSRFFSSTSATRSPRQRWRDLTRGDAAEAKAVEADAAEDKPIDDMPAEDSNVAAVNMVADEQDHRKPTNSPPLFASDIDLAAARADGAVFEFNPDNIDSLIADLEQASLAASNPSFASDVASDKHDNSDSNTETEGTRRAKPPVTSSQLKRRKFIKDDDKPQFGARETRTPYREPWQIQKQALKEKFPEGWQPRKRLSPDALEGIRALGSQFPKHYSTPVLAKHFEVSPEAIRRILKSHWKPSAEEEEHRQERWFKRGMNIWAQMAELGMKPPRRWRQEGVVRKPFWNQKRGPRTEYPYVRRGPVAEEEPVESAQRKLSENLL